MVLHVNDINAARQALLKEMEEALTANLRSRYDPAKPDGNLDWDKISPLGFMPHSNKEPHVRTWSQSVQFTGQLGRGPNEDKGPLPLVAAVEISRPDKGGDEARIIIHSSTALDANTALKSSAADVTGGLHWGMYPLNRTLAEIAKEAGLQNGLKRMEPPPSTKGGTLDEIAHDRSPGHFTTGTSGFEALSPTFRQTLTIHPDNLPTVLEAIRTLQKRPAPTPPPGAATTGVKDHSSPQWDKHRNE